MYITYITHIKVKYICNKTVYTVYYKMIYKLVTIIKVFLVILLIPCITERSNANSINPHSFKKIDL